MQSQSIRHHEIQLLDARKKIESLETKNNSLIKQYSENLECEVYSVLIKTHWIKIVQRRWKKIMAEQNTITMGRGSLANLRFFEMNGRHLPKYAVLPRLRGCLKDL